MSHDEIAQVQARKAGTAGIFTRASATYDQIGPRFFSHFGQRLVDLMPLEEGAQVLDVATGRGAVLFPAAQKIGATGQIVGIDLAEGMVQQTSAEVARRGLPNVRVLQMDAEELEFADASFDVVLAGFALFFFPRVEQALAEIYRVLKPGGRLATTTWGKPDERWNWMREVGVRPSGPPPGVGGGARSNHHGNLNWLDNPLKQAGFENQRVVEEELEMTFASAEEWWEAEWSHGARGCLERLTPEALESAKAGAYRKLEAQKEPGGIPHTYRVLFTFADKLLI